MVTHLCHKMTQYTIFFYCASLIVFFTTNVDNKLCKNQNRKRSIERIKKILDASNDLLEESNIESLTIAKISMFAGLKRTSTYKFFETPDEIKSALIKRYLEDCNQYLKSNLSQNPEADYMLCLKECVLNY